MKQLIASTEVEFLGFLLKTSFHDEKKYFQKFIDFEVVQFAVNQLMAYLYNEDILNSSNHLHIVKRIFDKEDITSYNCSSELGVCKKTFYRYKQKYLQIFRSYLINYCD